MSRLNLGGSTTDYFKNQLLIHSILVKAGKDSQPMKDNEMKILSQRFRSLNREAQGTLDVVFLKTKPSRDGESHFTLEQCAS